jgi:hypothetical protein
MDDTQRAAAAASVLARAQQGYELNLKLNFVPGRDSINTLRLGCQPRQGAQRVDVDPVDLPEPTRRFLVEVNKAMTEWLARDTSHQAAFIADPVAAFARAGISTDRNHAKALLRVREALGGTDAVTPGLQVMSVRSSVNVKGRVKPEDRKGNDWTAPPPDDGCGCGDQDARKKGA